MAKRKLTQDQLDTIEAFGLLGLGVPQAAPQKSVQPVTWGTAPVTPTVTAAPAAPAAAPAASSWFTAPEPVQNWNYNTETMAGPPDMFADTNLANVIADKARQMGFTGSVLQQNGQGQDAGPSTVSPEFQQWLQGKGLSLSGDWYAPAGGGTGGVTATLTDNTGKQVASENYATNDGDVFAAGALALTGIGLNAALGGGLGAAGGSVAPSTGGSWLAGVPAESLAALDAYAATIPTAAEMAAAVPSFTAGAAGGLLAGVPSEALSAVNAYAGAPLTPAQMTAATLPAGGLPGLAAPAASVPSVFNAAADSQAYNQAAGITGDAAAKAATAPATVNLGTFTNPAFTGGTQATTGGLTGLLNQSAQAIRDATASADLGGSALSTAGSTAGNLLQSGASGVSSLADWMKANPTLGRLAMSGLTGLLSSVGGGSAQGGASAPAGPPVGWNSPIQQGLLRQVQQVQPPTLAQTGLLNISGAPSSGAWRFLGG